MIVRNIVLGLMVAGGAALLALGPRGRARTEPPWELFPDMDRQPKIKYQTPTRFFADGRSARPPVPGTLPMGFRIPKSAPRDAGAPGVEPHPRFGGGAGYGLTGRMGDRWGDGFPMRVDVGMLKRGRARFEIFCAVCHGRAGLGNGVSGELGLVGIANLQERRVREMADGQIFHTIGAGKNAMKAYGDKVPVADRWAIVAYVRALQLSQGTEAAGLPAALRGRLEQETEAP